MFKYHIYLSVLWRDYVLEYGYRMYEKKKNSVRKKQENWAKMFDIPFRQCGDQESMVQQVLELSFYALYIFRIIDLFSVFRELRLSRLRLKCTCTAFDDHDTCLRKVFGKTLSALRSDGCRFERGGSPSKSSGVQAYYYYRINDRASSRQCFDNVRIDS